MNKSDLVRLARKLCKVGPLIKDGYEISRLDKRTKPGWSIVFHAECSVANWSAAD